MITRIEKQVENNNRIKQWINQLSTRSLVIVSLHVLILVFVVLIDGLNYEAKISLFAFLSAMTLWITTKIPAGFVAISLIMFIVIMGAEDPSLLYDSLSEEVVWLMVGSFIVGEAVKQSQLAERLTGFILRKCHKKSNVLLGVSSILFASVFFIPSTSGRAALSMPIIQQLSVKFSAKEQKVLAILAPVIILMSTSATLIGAGSHLIGIGLLESTVDQTISFSRWFILGVPFAIVISLVSLVIIIRILWPENELGKTVNVQMEEKMRVKRPVNRKEKKIIILLLLLIAGWMTERIHGYDIAFITMIGAILVMTPNYGMISWKQGIKSVSWNLILFVAAATALGKVLVDTGAVKWIESKMLHVLYLFIDAPEWLIVLIILLLTVSSHLYITSHTTRAIVFIPSLILFSETIGVNPSTVVFLSLIGMNYCVTVPVSSKALLLFYEEGEISYDASSLLKISAVLMPLYILIMMLFYFTYWQWMGLQL
jgi:anion transporter